MRKVNIHQNLRTTKLQIMISIKNNSSIIYETEKIPPVRSMSTLETDHPKVDFLFLFHNS